MKKEHVLWWNWLTDEEKASIARDFKMTEITDESVKKVHSLIISNFT